MNQHERTGQPVFAAVMVAVFIFVFAIQVFV